MSGKKTIPTERRTEAGGPACLSMVRSRRNDSPSVVCVRINKKMNRIRAHVDWWSWEIAIRSIRDGVTDFVPLRTAADQKRDREETKVGHRRLQQLAPWRTCLRVYGADWSSLLLIRQLMNESINELRVRFTPLELRRTNFIGRRDFSQKSKQTIHRRQV